MNAEFAVKRDVTVAPGRRTVLFVDDEARVLKSMRAMFRRAYNVLIANSGEEALALLSDNDVDVIVSDQRMPGMTGVEVLKEVKARAPRAMRILLTGYADLEAVEASINEGEVFRYLTKPCPSDQLKEAVGLAAEIACRDGASAAAVDTEAPPRVLTEGDEIEEAPERTAGEVVAFEAPELIPMLALDEDSETAAPGVVELVSPQSPGEVDLLVLSQDPDMVEAVTQAVDQRHVVHVTSSTDEAVEVLERNPVGVVITDRAVDEDAIAKLTTQLKRHVPELVTIVASGRSDAQMLIDLINYGQIFRFLLKPLRGGQCRLSVDAAVTKHLNLVADPGLRRRHVVETNADLSDSVLGVVVSRLRKVRDRFFTAQTSA